MNAAKRWAADLASWALPEELLAQATDDPWALPVELFARSAQDSQKRETPSRARALEALKDGGTVLDVGCGGGAAAFALLPKPGFVTGVDESEGMLAAFDRLARERGLAHETIQGKWPDVAGKVEPADIVVCHHVLYNVQDIEAFVRALADRARSRVVIELTAEHPRRWTNPFFEHFHSLERPERPHAEDAADVLRDLGFPVEVESWSQPPLFARHDDLLVGWLRKSLCLAPDREPEVAAVLERYPPPKERGVVTLWWNA